MAGRRAAETEGFVRRLNQACDDMPHLIPAHGDGRQITLAKRMGMSQEGVRKWFAGESMPRRAAMRKLAQLLDVEEPWLALGIMPEITTAEKRIRARMVDGAVLVAMGKVMLAGGSVAQPGDDDPRRNCVDFYAILHGVQCAVHVAYAKPSPVGRYDVMIPREFMDVRTLALIDLGNERHDFIEMPNPQINKHKVRRSGGYMISVNRIEGKYVTGSHVWRRIRKFGDLV